MEFAGTVLIISLEANYLSRICFWERFRDKRSASRPMLAEQGWTPRNARQRARACKGARLRESVWRQQKDGILSGNGCRKQQRIILASADTQRLSWRRQDAETVFATTKAPTLARAAPRRTREQDTNQYLKYLTRNEPFYLHMYSPFQVLYWYSKRANPMRSWWRYRNSFGGTGTRSTGGDNSRTGSGRCRAHGAGSRQMSLSSTKASTMPLWASLRLAYKSPARYSAMTSLEAHATKCFQGWPLMDGYLSMAIEQCHTWMAI